MAPKKKKKVTKQSLAAQAQKQEEQELLAAGKVVRKRNGKRKQAPGKVADADEEEEPDMSEPEQPAAKKNGKKNKKRNLVAEVEEKEEEEETEPQEEKSALEVELEAVRAAKKKAAAEDQFQKAMGLKQKEEALMAKISIEKELAEVRASKRQAAVDEDFAKAMELKKKEEELIAKLEGKAPEAVAEPAQAKVETSPVAEPAQAEVETSPVVEPAQDDDTSVDEAKPVDEAKESPVIEAADAEPVDEADRSPVDEAAQDDAQLMEEVMALKKKEEELISKLEGKDPEPVDEPAEEKPKFNGGKSIFDEIQDLVDEDIAPDVFKSGGKVAPKSAGVSELDELLGGTQQKKPRKESKWAQQQRAKLEDADSEVPDEDEEAESGEELEAKMRRAKPKAQVKITESSQPGFVSLGLSGVSMYIKNQEVLSDASWSVQTGERVGLVGANGCGKSTQLRILAGDVEPTSGDIIKSSPNLRITHFKQEFIDDIDMNNTLKDEFYSVFAEGVAVQNNIIAAEAELAIPETSANPERMSELLDKLNDWRADAKRLEVDAMESKVERVMGQMGFAPGEHKAKVSSFSGGWKMRIGMGKILLQDPNILLLDEPTNHLDLETVEWLENFLVEQKLPMVIVSHDREFLDRTCNKIVETLAGVTYSYDGSYSRHLELKEMRLKSWQTTWEAQEKKIKEEKKWIRQNKRKEELVTRVEARQRELDKFLASKEYVQKPPKGDVRFNFRFPQLERRGNEDDIVRCKDVSHGYNNQNLFEDFSLDVHKDDRIAFLGPNGAGKSTLFRLITGEEMPREGETFLSDRIPWNFYAQSTADELDLDDTVLGVITKAAYDINDMDETKIRALLGRFLFKGDSVFKKIRALSGGEKARVALARMMLTPASLLIMDEPTNHLDIPAKEMLEEALQNFDGTLLLISHDRYFLSKVATKIYALENRKFQLYDGDYKYYLSCQPGYQNKIDDRYVEGVSREIGSPIIVQQEQFTKKKKKKNFGGSQVSSGKKAAKAKNRAGRSKASFR